MKLARRHMAEPRRILRGAGQRPCMDRDAEFVAVAQQEERIPPKDEAAGSIPAGYANL